MVTMVRGLRSLDFAGLLLRTPHVPWSSPGQRPYLVEGNDLWISGRLLSLGDDLPTDIQVGETL